MKKEEDHLAAKQDDPPVHINLSNNPYGLSVFVPPVTSTPDVDMAFPVFTVVPLPVLLFALFLPVLALAKTIAPTAVFAFCFIEELFAETSIMVFVELLPLPEIKAEFGFCPSGHS